VKIEIYFCKRCRTIYVTNKRDASLLGFDIVPEDYVCKYCGNFLGYVESSRKIK